MWWFHFAVQFLCAGEAAPLPHLNQQQNEGQLRWEENLSERGGILEVICQKQKEQLRLVEICSDL